MHIDKKRLFFLLFFNVFDDIILHGFFEWDFKGV